MVTVFGGGCGNDLVNILKPAEKQFICNYGVAAVVSL